MAASATGSATKCHCTGSASGSGGGEAKALPARPPGPARESDGAARGAAAGPVSEFDFSRQVASDSGCAILRLKKCRCQWQRLTAGGTVTVPAA